MDDNLKKLLTASKFKNWLACNYTAINEINKLQENYTLDNNEKSFFAGAMEKYNKIKNPNKKMLNQLTKFINYIENINTDQKENFYKLWPEFKIA